MAMRHITPEELVVSIEKFKQYKRTALNTSEEMYMGAYTAQLQAIFKNVVLTSVNSTEKAIKAASDILRHARETFDWDDPRYNEIPVEKENIRQHKKKVIA